MVDGLSGGFEKTFTDHVHCAAWNLDRASLIFTPAWHTRRMRRANP